MASLNQCSFIGRLGQDPESRFTNNGEQVTSFSVACSESWKDKNTGEKKELTEWVNITAFGKLAEICDQYLNKGSQVYVSGKFKTDKYEKEGQTHYSTKIIAKDLVMLGGKSDGTPQATQNQQANRNQEDAPPSPDFDDD